MENIRFLLSAIISISFFVVVISIVIDFVLYNEKTNVKKSKKSVVATGSMFLFFGVYYLVIRFRIGMVPSHLIVNTKLILYFMLIGTVFIAFGAVVNVLGRLELKSNWANHIKIYEGHTLVNKGVYKIVRHPLYASIMLMLFGGSLVYINYLSGLLTIVIFIPSMYYRAKQEENLLLEELKEYSDYRDNVGMFFPKLIKR